MVAASWLLSLVTLSSIVLASPAAQPAPESNDVTHSYGEDYGFGAEDGWEDAPLVENEDDDEPIVGATNITLPTGNVHKRAVDHRKRSLYSSLKGLFQPITSAPETAKITWYTGNDLKNPNCWANPKWNPTDNHYIAAVTLNGWKNKPKCFEFLELCNGTKCTFVRIVDACAGCSGSHVDLTKTAFKSLVPLDVGVKKVKMRRVGSQPSNWRSDLWGPKK